MQFALVRSGFIPLFVIPEISTLCEIFLEYERGEGMNLRRVDALRPITVEEAMFDR